jgi:hypothetical protein
MDGRRGQALVELAVTLPFVMFLFLGAVESAFLLTQKAHQDRSTAVVAQWASSHPGESWHSVAAHELPGCEVAIATPLPDLLEAQVTCHYSPKVLVMWNGLEMSSQESAATLSETPTETPPSLVSPSTIPVASPSF